SVLNDRQAGLDQELQLKQDLEVDVQKREEQIREGARERDAYKETYLHARARLGTLEELEASSGDLKSSLQQLYQKHPQAKQSVYGVLTDFIAFDQGIEEWAPRAVNA